MTPLAAQIVAARAYHRAYSDAAATIEKSNPAASIAAQYRLQALVHKRAAEIMEDAAAEAIDLDPRARPGGMS